MNPMQNLTPSPMDNGLNLFNILVNVAFGFAAGLMFLFGPKEVIDFGTKLATNLTGMGSMAPQMASFGFASYAPYIVLAPIAGIVVKQLTAVRNLKTFLFFAVAVIIGFGIAYFTQGYFKTLIS